MPAAASRLPLPDQGAALAFSDGAFPATLITRDSAPNFR